MDWSVAFPGKYLKADDLQGKVYTLTIKDVRIDDIEGMDGTKKQKVVITFKETPKAWIVPVTCGLALRAMWGRETNDWKDQQVSLFPKKVESFGETVEAVRVAGSPSLKAPIKEVIKRGKKNITVDLVPTKPTPTKAEAAREPGE
jgi:hypothetical protein